MYHYYLRQFLSFFVGKNRHAREINWPLAQAQARIYFVVTKRVVFVRNRRDYEQTPTGGGGGRRLRNFHMLIDRFDQVMM